MLVSNHSKFKGIMDARRNRKNPYFMRPYLFASPFTLGPCLVSDIKSRETFLWIPQPMARGQSTEEAIKTCNAWRFWIDRGATEVENGLQYNLTGKQNLQKWLDRATERFGELWN